MKIATLRISISREDDGRWIGDCTALPGALAYGKDAGEAWRGAVVLALRVLADRIDQSEAIPESVGNLFPAYLNADLLSK
jgi:predicted RNase H-like HicB family nuclease